MWIFLIKDLLLVWQIFCNELLLYINVFIDGVDYIGVSVDLLFRTGSSQGTQMLFEIPIIDDVTDEPDETILLQASTSAPGQVPTQAPGLDTATVVIRDDDCGLLILLNYR